jgi:hypothetical protein
MRDNPPYRAFLLFSACLSAGEAISVAFFRSCDPLMSSALFGVSDFRS